MHKKFLLIGAIVCTFMAGCFYFSNRNTLNNSKLTLYGNIEIRQVNLSFQVPGKIEKMLKEEGDTVSAGETIALLDDKDYQANYAVAVASVAQTKAIAADTKLKYERSKSLLAKKAIPQQSFDSAKFTYEQACANYQAALAQESLTKNQLLYTKLVAPEEGIVTVRVAEPGTTVAATQTVFTLSKNKPMWIRAFVNETELGNIKHGMKAIIQTDTKNPNTGMKRNYVGHIGYISPIAEFTPKSVQSTDIRTSLVYRIHVYVDDVDDFLRQGMPTTVVIDLTANGKNSN